MNTQRSKQKLCQYKMYLRKLGPIIYSQDHSALSKLAFLVDSIQKKICPGKKKKHSRAMTLFCVCEFYNRNSRQLLTPFILLTNLLS